MNETLKAAGSIGAELGAVKADNDKLRGLLRDTAAVAITMLYDSHRDDVLAEFTVPELEAVVKASAHLQSAKVEHVYRRAWDAALSQQAEPRCEYCDGTGDVHRADGEWLGECKECVEPAPAQDEREAFKRALHNQKVFKLSSATIDAAEWAWFARPAQTEQRPIGYQFQDRDGKWNEFLDQRHYENTLADGGWPIRAIYAAPVAQTEQTELVEALRWYAEKVAECRKIGSLGDNARQALDLDGGFRALDALADQGGE